MAHQFLIDPYSNLTWYYVFLQQHSYQKPEQHTFTVKFDQNGLVSSAELDKPLPEVAKQDENNTIIGITAITAPAICIGYWVMYCPCKVESAGPSVIFLVEVFTYKWPHKVIPGKLCSKDCKRNKTRFNQRKHYFFRII